MRRRGVILVAALAAVLTSGGDEGRPASELPAMPLAVSLSDQWERPAELRAPLGHITVLTLADRSGAEQLTGWIRPLKTAFGTNIQFFAVADVQAVPAPLRGLVRRRFARDYSYPVALDWGGDVTAQLPVSARSANLFVLNRDARVRHKESGECTPVALGRLKDALTDLLAARGTARSRDPGLPSPASASGPP